MKSIFNLIIYNYVFNNICYNLYSYDHYYNFFYINKSTAVYPYSFKKLSGGSYNQISY